MHRPCFRACVAPPDFLSAIKRSFRRVDVTVPLKVPRLHEPALGVHPLDGVAGAHAVPGAVWAALRAAQAAAIVNPRLPDVLMRAALRPVLALLADPDRLLGTSTG